jgi:hypothetical protein
MIRQIQSELDPSAHVICHKTLLHVVYANKLSRDANATRTGAGLHFSAAGLVSLSPTLDRLGLASIISLSSGEINIWLDGKARLDVEQTIRRTDITLATETLQAGKNASADLPRPARSWSCSRRLFRGRECASPYGSALRVQLKPEADIEETSHDFVQERVRS